MNTLANLSIAERELISLERQRRMDAKRMRNLTRLIERNRDQEPGEGKRANWLKFCHRCGIEISELPRGVVYCPRCQREMERS